MVIHSVLLCMTQNRTDMYVLPTGEDRGRPDQPRSSTRRERDFTRKELPGNAGELCIDPFETGFIYIYIYVYRCIKVSMYICLYVYTTVIGELYRRSLSILVSVRVGCSFGGYKEYKPCFV